MRLSRWFALRGLAALVVTLAAACGSTPKPAPAAPIRAEAPPPEFHGTPVDAPIVTLVDAGHGAKRQLRYAPTRGARGHLDMRMKLHMVLNMLGRSMPVDVPVVTMAMETEVLATSDSAFDFTAKVTNADIDSTGIDPKVAAKVRASVAKLTGMSTTLRMDYRGVVLAADVQVPAGVDQTVQQMIENFRQSMTQAAAPLPEEAVGAGARWSVAMRIKSPAMSLDQTANYVLNKLDGDRAEATLDLVQTAPRQVLAAVLPTAFDLTVKMQMDMSIAKADGSAQDAMKASMAMDMGLTMTGAPLAK